MMFSQLHTTDPNTLRDVLMICLAGLGAAAIIWNFSRAGRKQKRTVEPDPIRVQPMPELVTKEFCAQSRQGILARLDGHDEAIKAIRSEMKLDRENSEAAARVRSAGIYKKIDDLRLELSDKMDAIRLEAKKDTEGVHTRLSDVLAAVSNLRGRLGG